MRDLLINAPSRLDALTQQMVDVTARMTPSEQAFAALRTQFSDSALASVAGNIETAATLAFADQNITNGRTLVSRPVGRQSGLVDSIRAAESSLGQARSLLDAIDSAGTDINRAIAIFPGSDRGHPAGHQSGGAERCTGQNAARHRAWRGPRRRDQGRVADAQSAGATDPLGAFTKLTQADAELDQLLASIAEEREAPSGSAAHTTRP